MQWAWANVGTSSIRGLRTITIIGPSIKDRRCIIIIDRFIRFIDVGQFIRFIDVHISIPDQRMQIGIGIDRTTWFTKDRSTTSVHSTTYSGNENVTLLLLKKLNTIVLFELNKNSLLNSIVLRTGDQKKYERYESHVRVISR